MIESTGGSGAGLGLTQHRLAKKWRKLLLTPVFDSHRGLRDCDGPAISRSLPQLFSQAPSQIERNIEFKTQTEPNKTKETNPPLRNADFTPWNQERRMSEAKQRHCRKIEALGVAAYSKAIAVPSDPAHLTTLSCPPLAHERLF